MAGIGIKGTTNIRSTDDMNRSIEQIRIFSKTRQGVLNILKAVQPSPENAHLYEQVLHATKKEITHPRISSLQEREEADKDKRDQEMLVVIEAYATLEQDTRKVLQTAQIKNNPLQQYACRLLENQPKLPHDKRQIQEGIARIQETINKIEPLNAETLFKAAETQLAGTEVPQNSPEVLLMLQLLLGTQDYLLQELIKQRDRLKKHLDTREERKEKPYESG